ncbi:MAG: hypothetical protein ACYDCA_03580 [Candidatus Tyrphobacter sp.]
MSYNAYVFTRPGGADILGFPYGHVAFGFQTDDNGIISVGGVEVVTGKTSHVDNAMDFWTRQTTDPLGFMSSQTPCGFETRYDMCKVLPVASPNIDAATAQIERIRNTNYNILSQNCRTDVVEVLEAYGVTGLPGGARPSGFFGGIHAAIVPLTAPWPGRELDFSIYGEPDQYGFRDDPQPNAQGYAADLAADQNPNGPDWPARYYGSFLVRRGFLTLFPDENYSGQSTPVPTGSVLNARDLPWPSKMVGSWYATAAPHESQTLALRADSILPRFASSGERRLHASSLALPPHFGLADQLVGQTGQ